MRRISIGRRIPFLAGALLTAAVAVLAARSDAREDDALALYAKNCSSCHGESGRGDGPSGLMMKQKPADLRSPSVRTLSDDEIFDRITDGKPPMPAFGKRLSVEDRRALVRYVRELGTPDR